MVPETVTWETGEQGHSAEQPPEPPSTALDGRIRLGEPISVPVSTEFTKDDAALRTFVEQEAARYAYHLVHLAITAVSESGQAQFESLSVALRLSATQPAPAPVAWSMTPLRVTDVAQLTTTFHLGPQLKLFNVEAELGAVDHEVARPSTQIYLEALNELRNDPTWALRRTRDMKIRGTHRLALVVRAPVGVESRIDGSVHATVVRGARLWRERTEMPDLLSLSAVL
jgi:hypothetical protein